MMDFRKELIVKPLPKQINLQNRVLLTGSCFSENLGAKLKSHRFRVLINPHGILFNPISIVQSLRDIIAAKIYTQQDLFHHDDLWKSWTHHSQFSGPEIEFVLHALNQSNQLARAQLKQGNWLILTLGSAWVYTLADGGVVANCHKIPTDKFQKKLLSVVDVKESIGQFLNDLQTFNPDMSILFTISPVRHLRDGFVENNLSKAILIQSVHELVKEHSNLYYFPAYELILDDLRDYRFYAEDMVHPNYLATDYVWEKFQKACIDENSRSFFADINRINAAKAHKAFQPTSEAHRKFRKKNLELVKDLEVKLPFLNWEDDIRFFQD